ncbi:YhjD/YihY/BrkB family envelope integrity protein [Nocardioides pantholopis]|uniref:YhjD/YihY/BrkB family envelope integrity protein n=1 Tax=Nocardioides pantholopis TaxID=2483798 RepID=UPI000F08135C|nr:YhjD/YihY/BrkB family envelope integrity protein [Nocardioides pantholopis]
MARVSSRLGGWLDALERYPPTRFLVRCLRIFLHIEGRDRVLMLAGQGFLALIPMLLVLASFASSSGAGRVGEEINRRMGLTGNAAEAVSTLFAYPPGTTGGATVLSLALLIFSLNGFARSVQQTFEGAWGLPRMGIRGTAYRAAGLAVLLTTGFTVGWVGRPLDSLESRVLLGLVGQAAIGVVGWLVGTSLMLSRRVPARDLLAGAVLSTVLQLIVGWGTAIYLPDLFARNAERYGVVGVALALVTWLVTVASVVVGAAILGAVLGTGGGGPVRAAAEGPPGSGCARARPRRPRRR